MQRHMSLDQDVVSRDDLRAKPGVRAGPKHALVVSRRLRVPRKTVLHILRASKCRSEAQRVTESLQLVTLPAVAQRFVLAYVDI